MAAVFLYFHRQRRQLRRNRVFRARTHPLEVFNDDEVYNKFRFRRHHLYELANELQDDLQYQLPRKCTLPPVLQVCLALRFYETGTFEDAVGELIGVHQSTASRTVSRVTEALLRRLPTEIKMPSQKEADDSKAKFYGMNPGFPNTMGCIDGTHIPIQEPVEAEHEYVNRKNFHSINAQVVCNADMQFINVVVKWPGSVHDARILRESPLFQAFESPRKPVDGLLLGDSGYMLRDWLMTPIPNPSTPKERGYNYAHSSTRAIIERTIGAAKRRWHCLGGGLRLEPAKACQVITVCFMLHNRATRLRLDPPESDEEGRDDDPDDDVDDCSNTSNLNERARRNARPGSQTKTGQ